MPSRSKRAGAVVVALALLIGGCRGQGTAPPSPSPSLLPPAPAAPPNTIRNFVTPLYPEGVPYDEARSFGVGAVKELLSLIDEPSMVDSRSNVVVTIGMIGGATAEAALRKVVEQGTGKQSQAQYLLRLDAEMSLGYAANVATTPDTLNYLIAGLQSGVWDSRVLWERPEGGNPFLRLRERTIMALGLSGKPEAKTAMQNLVPGGGRGGRGGRGASPPLTSSEEAIVNEAIRANDYIATHSLSQYFKDYR